MPCQMALVLLALAPQMAAALRTLALSGEPSEPKCNLRSIPKFVLNLDRRPDRLAGLRSRIHDAAPWLLENMCRVRAPDGRALGESISPSLVNQSVWKMVWAARSGRLLKDAATRGNMACFMGHALVWEHVLEMKAPWSVVFEDDIAHLHPGIGDFLCRVLEGKEEALQDGWEYVQMELGRTFKGNDAYPLRAVPGMESNTGMYLITREGAARMLNLSFPLQECQLDSRWGVLLRNLKGFMTLPKAAGQMSDVDHGDRDTDTQLARARVDDRPEQDILPLGSGDHFRTRIRNCARLRRRRMAKPELLEAYSA